MAIVRKFTIGVMPFSKMFRVHSMGGAVTDAILRLRGKALPEHYFSEVGVNSEHTGYRVTSEDQLSSFQLTEESINLSKDYYEADVSFDFRKVLEEFRTIWTAVNSVLGVHDIRRIGIVAEYRFAVDSKSASTWLRTKFTNLPTTFGTDKFHLKFEEREYAADGKMPDVKKSDFINHIYSYYDSAMDATHPVTGCVDVDLDVQRYYTPLHNSNVGDEVLKLHKHLDLAQRQLDEHMKAMGATHAKK